MKKRNYYWNGIIRTMIPFILVTVLFSPFFQSCQKEEIKIKTIEPEKVTLKSITTSGSLTYFTTPEEFPCSGVPTEDFEKATNSYPRGIMNPLDAATNTDFLPAGSILPGISFTLTRTGQLAPYPPDSPDLDIWAGSNGVVGHIVIANHQDETLIIEFTDNNVTAVGMKLITVFSNQATFDINIYGNSETLLGNKQIIGGTPVGTYFGVQSENPIKKITIFGFDYVNWGNEPPGVDDVMFGTCILDSDGDGCPDSQDAVVNSNMEPVVEIDGCSTGVPNKMTLSETCGTTMSDVIDGLEKGTYKNHGEFVNGITKIVNEWSAKGLITLEEKGAIVSCAAKSSIGQKK